MGLVVALLAGIGCAEASSSPERLTGGSDAPTSATASDGTESAPAEPAGNPVASPTKPKDDPGPAPKGCSLQKDGDGFFTRDTGTTKYVGYVPASYDGSPTRLLVGLHGCGDAAYNFATWAVAPWATRDSQTYIGISVDGASGGGNCWDGSDAKKVLAAIDDVASCLYVHKQKVVLAGFSSGGMLAYSVALQNADRFAGLLVLNSTLSWAGNADALLGNAAYKLPIAHRAHTQDSVFPINTVRSDWNRIRAAGFSLQTNEVSGDHDGTSDDWTDWLLPQMESWQAP